MPYYNTNLDNIQLYYEERGQGERQFQRERY